MLFPTFLEQKIPGGKGGVKIFFLRKTLFLHVLCYLQHLKQNLCFFKYEKFPFT